MDKASRSALAGDSARSKYANVDAGTFYERALSAAEELDPPEEDQARVWEALGDVRELFAKFDESDEAYVQALEHGAAAPGVLRKRGIVAERQGRYDDALALYDSGSAEADANERVALQIGRAIVFYRQGNIDNSARTAEEAANAAAPLDDREALASAYWIRALAEAERSGPARDFLALALPIFEEFGLLQMQVKALNLMAMLAFYVSEWETAVEYYGRAEEMARRAGDVIGAGIAALNHGELRLNQGLLEEAQQLLESALRTFRAAKYPIGEALTLVYLGHLAAEQSRFEDALGLLDTAVEQLTSTGSKSLLIEADARRAQAYVLEGRHEEAATLARACLDREQETGEVGARTALLERLLAVAAVQGRRRADALPHFEESLRIGREHSADYEVGRTLQAKVLTGFASDSELEEGEAIMARLGVVSLPAVPLP